VGRRRDVIVAARGGDVLRDIEQVL
jgi:hypothetical protein